MKTITVTLNLFQHLIRTINWRSRTKFRMTVNHARCNIVNYGNNKGIALVITLLVLALLMVIVLEFGSNMRVEARAAANFRDDMKAYYLAKSGVTFAIALLEEDAKTEPQNVDSLNEIWAQKIPPLPVGDGLVSVEITDEHSKINVNKLATGLNAPGVTGDKMRDLMVRLLEQFELKGDIANAITDWIDKDEEERTPGGAERGFYEGSTESYEAKNKPLDSLQELRLIKGVEDDIFDKLKNFLTVVQSDGLININTASREVLLSLSDEMDEDIVNTIIAERIENPLQKVLDLSRYIDTSGTLYGEISKFLTVKSDFFSITATGEVNKNRKTIHAVAHRQQGKTAIVYWRVE